MRKILPLVLLVVAVGLVGVGTAAASSSPPVNLSGKTNVHGKKDVSKKSKAAFTLEADDFYFSPTFIKVKPGEKLTLTLKNEGKAQHTFTSSALGVDKTLQPDTKTKVTITIPSGGSVLAFHCDFHQAMGMQGAFYTRPS
jgi:plastocyanin